MGPYARVDYWPLPSCDAGEECLAGPYWSRDASGGQSRGVDPYSCVNVPSLPYTCGSPGRQSLTRYFVNTFITQPNSNGSRFQEAVLAQLHLVAAQHGQGRRIIQEDAGGLGALVNGGHHGLRHFATVRRPPSLFARRAPLFHFPLTAEAAGAPSWTPGGQSRPRVAGGPAALRRPRAQGR